MSASRRSLRYAWLLLAALFFSCATYAQNLLIDGGFELSGKDPAVGAWMSKGPGAGIEPGAGRSVHGTPQANHAAWLRSPTDFSSEWIQPLLPLTTGSDYLLTAWVRLEGPTPAQAALGVRTQNGFSRIYRGLAGEGWEQIQFMFTASDGWAQVVLSSSAGAHVYFDDVTLQEYDTEMERLASAWQARMQEAEQEQLLYTGLVIDARGTGLERGMSPKIYDTVGRLIFAGEGASHDQLISKGIAAYVRSLEEATAHSRLAVNPAYPMRLPLVLDAQRATGRPLTTAVVGEEDGKRIRRATNQYDFLGRFAVVFVVD